MCLEKCKRITVATDNIVVYKHIIRVRNSNNKFLSSYQNSPIEFDKELKTNTSIVTDYLGDIYEGFHAYTHKSPAIKNGREYNEVVVECIIPKGSEIAYGMFNHNFAIVSNRIIYSKIIKDFTPKY